MKRPLQTTLVLVFLSLLLATPASAQLEGNPENWCRNGHLPRESKDYRLAKIKGAAGDKVYFHDDGHERCPADQSCRGKAYVITNDQVIVSRTFGRFACSWFQPRKGNETVGWIESDRLEWLDSKRQPTEGEWLGEWRAYDNSIRISKATVGELSITGEAIWGSGSRTHTGKLDHNAKPSADKMNFGDGRGEYDCRVAMQLVGPYLVVGDNLNCGGANVSFSGVYQRAKR